MENKDTGLLLQQQDILLHRQWFQEMTKLLGIKVLYRTPKEGKTYTLYGELDTNYNPPEIVGCIFDEHPTIKTTKKLGWNSELQEGTSVIHVPYDLKGLQVGALFIVPSPLDKTQGRVFKVIQMSVGSIYPASIACEIGPVWESTMDRNRIVNHEHTNFNLLNEEEEEN